MGEWEDIRVSPDDDRLPSDPPLRLLAFLHLISAQLQNSEFRVDSDTMIA